MVRRIVAATLAGLVIAGRVEAMPPVDYTLDGLGVDLKSGSFNLSRQVLSIGPAGSSEMMALVIEYNSQESRIGPLGRGWSHNYEIRAERRLENGATVVNVVTGMATVKFTKTNGAYVSDRRSGDALVGTMSGALEDLTYHSRAGDVLVFRPSNNTDCADVSLACDYHLVTWTKPDREKLTFAYPTNWSGANWTTGRLSSVTSSLGWNISFGHDANGRLIWAQAVNLATDYCPDVNGAPWCDLGNWPKVTFGYTSDGRLASVTDTQGRVRRFGYDAAGRMIWTKRPSSTGNERTIVYDATGRVTKQTIAGVGTWTYGILGGTARVTAPGYNTTTVYFGSSSQPLSITDPLGNVTSFSYDAYGRLTRRTAPEGDSVVFTYDGRGNVTRVTRNPKPGSSLAPIVTSAGYRGDASAYCSPVPTPLCNRPLWTTDALGNRTDFVYDGNARALSSVTLPADASGVRPRWVFGYTFLHAWVKTSSGGVREVADGVWRRTAAAICPSGTTCSNREDLRSWFSYGPASGVATNRALSTVTVDPFGLLIRRDLSYDRWGNVVVADGPLPGDGDATHFRHDSERRVVGVISPDPDGSGPLPRPAVRISYDVDGLVIRRETGTVQGLSDADWSAFSVARAIETSRDMAGHVVETRVVVGGVVESVRQLSYDGLGRLSCVAERMNGTVFGLLPSSACRLSDPGTQGWDRIVRREYDAAGRLTALRAAVGLSVERVVARYSWSANGRLVTVTDGRGNVTTLDYDGFDRLLRRRHPDPVTVGTSSWTDVEAFAYDAAGHMVSMRRRDGQVASFSYDALGRLVAKDLPGTSLDVSWTYDLAGRPLSVSRPSGDEVRFVWDKAGRLVRETQAGRSVAYAYDAAGRRTRMTWPDGFYVTYGYDLLGRTTAVRENGTDLLARFSYDALGRRTLLTRGNGTVTLYDYDGQGRLVRLRHDLAGGANDYDAAFSYTPSSRIGARTQVNGLYGWAVGPVGSESYGVDGLDRLTHASGRTITYDGRGNVTGDGLWSYAWDVENRLTGVSGPANLSLGYDVLGRLARLTEGGRVREFLYDGARIIGEYDGASGALVRRYVPGPGVDEHLVWYEGSGLSDRRWFHQDERGSVVAVSDGSGVLLGSWRYGPYGESGMAVGEGGNGFVRFGYTGRLRLPGTTLLHYRARVYAPDLGRFLQADPIGFASGRLNLYAYVGNDPINATDPSGMMEDGAVPCTGTRIRRPCDSLPGFMLFVPGHAGGPARAGGTVNVPSCASIPGCDGEIVATPSPFPALDFSSIFDLPSVFRGGPLPAFALRRSALGRSATAGGMMGEGEERIDNCITRGGVTTVATSVDVFFVVGLGLNVGVFRNEETGQMGLFGSIEFGIGLDASVGVNFGRASSAGALNGFSVFLSGSYGVVEGQVSFALDGFGELGGVPKTGGYALGMPAGLSAGGSFGFVTCPFADQASMH